METSFKLEEKSGFAPTLIREIEAAIKRFNMYPADHPAAKLAAEIPYKTLIAAFSRDAQVLISLMEGRLAVNGKPVEGLAGKSVLAEAITALNISSISLSAELSLEKFQSFLKYFVGKTGGKIEWSSLQDHIIENKISGIGIDEFRYELVGKDQKVVDNSATLIGRGGGISIGSLFEEYPELILGLLANKQSAKGSIPQKYVSCMDFSKLSGLLEDEIKDLSDKQLMNIIAVGLRDNIKDATDYDEVDIQQSLFTITEILKRRNQAELLPKIKRIVDELHLIDRRFLDLIFDKKYSRKRLAFEELENVREDLKRGVIKPERLELIPKRLEIYNDEEYTRDYIKGLADYAISGSDNREQLSSGFDFLVKGAIESESEGCLRELHNQIKEILNSYKLPDDKFEYFLKRVERLVAWLIKDENLPLLKDIFDAISIYASKELITSASKRQAARDFYERIGTYELAGELVKKLKVKFEALNKVIFDIMKHLQTQAVAMRLCENLSYPERSIRLFVIRILSEYERVAPRSFEIIISDRKLTERPPDQALLPLDNWYKLRNIILISGNIATLESLKILEGFIEDPDPRIAEEMILALEKIKSEKACDMLASYLYFDDDKIRHRAAVALGNMGDDRYLDKLIDAYGQESEIREQMIPIIARLGREKSLPFFRQLLFMKTGSAWKSFLGKSSEDIKMQILSTLVRIPSRETVKLLDDYKANFGRGLGSLFKSNRLLSALEKTRRSVLSKMKA